MIALALLIGCSIVHVDADTALPVPDAPDDTATTPTTETGSPIAPPRFAVCVDTRPAFEAPVPDFATEIAPLFERCVTCHRSNPTGLEFTDPYAELVNVPSTQVPTMDRVEPGDLRNSYLWHKLCGTQLEVGGTGSWMPIETPFEEAEAVLVGAWILSGAAAR